MRTRGSLKGGLEQRNHRYLFSTETTLEILMAGFFCRVATCSGSRRSTMVASPFSSDSMRVVASPTKLKWISPILGAPLKYLVLAASTVELPRCSTKRNGPVPFSRCVSGPEGPPFTSFADMMGRNEARKMNSVAG